MNLEELHTQKDRMEEAIFIACQAFEKATGLTVSSISLSRAAFVGVRTQALTDVHAYVELGSR